MTEQTIKCPICGGPYKVYAYTVKDQSACPRCVRQAEQEVERAWPPPFSSPKENPND